MSRVFTLVAIALFFLTTSDTSSAESIIPDVATATVLCNREDDALTAIQSQHTELHDTVDTYRIRFGSLCRSYFDGNITGEGWLSQFLNAQRAFARVALVNNQSVAQISDISTLPTGLRSYSTLLLPVKYSRSDTTTSSLKGVLAAFTTFSKKTGDSRPGIILVGRDNLPDTQLSTTVCKSLFQLGLCDFHTFVVTTAQRPDIWARNGHTPDAMVFDLSYLNETQTACFLNLITADVNPDLATGANIVATMKAVAAKYASAREATSALVSPAGWAGKMEFFVVDKLLSILPCN